MRSDGDGNPACFFLSKGQEHDINKGIELTRQLPDNSLVIADKGYDCHDFRISLLVNNISPLIPSRSNRAYKPPYDKNKYKIRYRIECFFNRLKQNRGFATRYDKLAIAFLSGTSLLCAMIASKT